MVVEEKRPKRARKVVYAEKVVLEDSNDDDEEINNGNGQSAGQNDDNEKQEDDANSLFSISVDRILWRRQNSEGEYEYLVKYHNRSYLHLEWLSEENIATIDGAKTKLAKFLKTIDEQSSVKVISL